GLLLDFAKAHHLSRDARSTLAAEASTHPLGLASWNGFAQDGTVGGMDADDEATWTYSRRVPAWARPFREAPHASGKCFATGQSLAAESWRPRSAAAWMASPTRPRKPPASKVSIAACVVPLG